MMSAWTVGLGGLLVKEVGFWGCFWCGGRIGDGGLKYLKEKSIYFIFCNKFDIVCSIPRVYRIFTYTIVFSVKISIELIYHMGIFIIKIFLVKVVTTAEPDVIGQYKLHFRTPRPKFYKNC